jgi:hypothetical protein
MSKWYPDVINTHSSMFYSECKHLPATKFIIRAYFGKKIALLNSLTLSVRLSVCPSVCTLFFRQISTYDLQILDSKRRLSIYREYGWVFRSKAQEL